MYFHRQSAPDLAQTVSSDLIIAYQDGLGRWRNAVANVVGYQSALTEESDALASDRLSFEAAAFNGTAPAEMAIRAYRPGERAPGDNDAAALNKAELDILFGSAHH